MARLVGRRSVDTKITLESGSIPIYNSNLRAWDTITLSEITSSVFPFTGTAKISGSLIVDNFLKVTGSAGIQPYINNSGDTVSTEAVSLLVQPKEIITTGSADASIAGIISTVSAKSSGSGIASAAGGYFIAVPYGTSTGYITGVGLQSSATRNNSLDTSTNSNNVLFGINVGVNHRSTLNPSASTRRAVGVNSQITTLSGLIISASGHFAGINLANATNTIASVTTYAGLRTGGYIGAPSGTGSGILTNYYDLLLEGPLIQATGTITNRWGIYQVQSSYSNYFAGNVGIGKIASASLDVSGSVLITGSLNVAGGITGSLSNLQNSIVGHIPFFSSSQVLADSIARQIDNGSGSFSIVINQNDVTTAAPEALYVYQPSATSYNVISGKGNLNNYLQLNIQNTNTGTTASSDIVATANNGNESVNYIDMGINNSSFSGSIGEANDAYLYSTGNDLHIGNASNFPIQFFAGGIDNNANKKLQLSPNNQHQMTGSLDVSGSIIAKSFTGSFEGTASWANNALTASYALNIPVTSSYAISSSNAINADTASYVLNAVSASYWSGSILNATSASYAATASSADNFTVRGTLTAQTIVAQTITSSIEFITGSTRNGSLLTNTHQFTGSVLMTGSLTANGYSSFLNNANTGIIKLQNSSPSGWSSFEIFNSSNSTVGGFGWGNASAPALASTMYFDVIGNNPFIIRTNSSERIRIFGGGNIGINTGTTDNGYRFQVNGSGSASGSVWVSGSSVFSGSVTSTTGFTGSLLGTATTASYWSGSIINASSASYWSGSILNATSASYALTASYVLSPSIDTSSFATTGSNIFVGNQTITGSFLISGSTIQIGNNTLLGNTTLTGSITVSGPLRLDPTLDPGLISTTSSFLFTSASNTATGYDLYYRQGSNNVKFKWFEGVLNTGVLYGGVLTYSSSYFYVSSGSGIIVNHNATAGSEISPTITYVNWAASSHSIATPSAQNTYVFIDTNGNLQQQTSFFTPEQYHEALPIGRVSHYGATGSTITGVGNNMLTAYDVPQQLGEFARAFGPLKINGFTITPQVGNLSLNIGSGTAFNLGGYYQNSPDLPSSYNSNTYVTSSIIRIYRSGSGFQFDNNGGSYYTSVNPTLYDNGTGTLATVGNGNWSIQRVFVNPITGRSHVYYGQSTYTTYLNAVQSVATDDFIESEVTKNAYVFAGYLVMNGNSSNTDLSVSGTTNAIIQSGLFRNSVGGSGGASTAVSDLNDLSDVNISSPSNGQALIYSSGLWVNGNPSSASYSQTSSYADNFTVGNTLTAQRIVVQTVSSSIVYSSGSNRFGNNITDTQTFTGSVGITGSLDIKGNQTITGSLNVLNGNIRLDAPDPFLIISASANGRLLQLNPGSGYIDATSTSLYINRFSTTDIILASGSGNGGRVGIRKIPTAPLDINGNAIITGSLNVTGGITGSLLGTATTASYWSGSILHATSASYALTASFIDGMSNGTASYALQALTASNANTASSADDFTVRGTLTAQTIVAQTITSSIDFVTGSSRFGSNTLNTHQFTGSVTVSGSLQVNGTNVITSNQTSSMSVATASYAINATGSFIQGGNSFGAAAVIGTNDTNNLTLETNGTSRLFISSSGNIGVGLTSIVPDNLAVGNSTSASFGITSNRVAGSVAAPKYLDLIFRGFNDDVMAMIRSWDESSNTSNGYLTFSVRSGSVGNFALTEAMRINRFRNVLINTTTDAGFRLDVSGSTRITNGLTVTGSLNAPSITGSLLGTATTASYVLNTVSSSYSATSSYANNFTVANTFTFDGTLNDYSSVASSIVGSNNIFTQSTGSYRGAFYKYTLYSGSNARSGEIMAVWNGGSVQYTDVSTLDLGITSAVTASVAIVTAQAQLNFQTNTSGWTIKVLSTYI